MSVSSNLPIPLPVTGTVNANNSSVGSTGAAAPTSATEIGIIDNGGNLQGVSATNPVPVTGTVVVNPPAVQPVSGTVTIADNSQVNMQDSVGEPLYGTNNALNVHLAGNEILNLDGPGNLGVNVQGTVPVSVTFPAVQPVSGIVSISNLPPLGPQLSGNSSSVVLAGDQKMQVNMRDAVGEDLYGTNNNLNVHLAGNEILNLDGPGNLGVNVQGTVPVLVTTPAPVNVLTSTLPTNASQETGGNLATIATQSRNNAQMIDLLSQILAVLQYQNVILTSSFGMPMDDTDSVTSTMIQ